RFVDEAVGNDAHENAARMPARGGKPAEQRAGGGRFVEMHRLRVELGGEGDDFLTRHPARAVDGNRALFEIFPMAFRHSSFCSPPQPGLSHMTAIRPLQRRAQVANLKCITSPSATT